MALQLLTGITGPAEAALVAALAGPGAGVTVVRRCADLPDVLAAAEAGLAEAAVLSADLGQLDLEAVGRLQRCGVAVVGLAPEDADDPDGEAVRRLRRLGVDAVLAADVPPDRLAGRLVEAVRQAVARRQAEEGARGGGLLLGERAVPAGPVGRAAAADPGDALPVRPSPPSPRRPRAGDAQPEANPEGRIVAVWGPAGAPGRTTVAAALATQLARHGDVLLVDADTHGASLAQALGLLDESAGLAAAARAANQGALTVAKLAELAPTVAPGLRVLTGLAQPRRWPELRSAALDEVWLRARALAGWTVVDAGFGLEADEELLLDVAAPRRHAATLSALGTADRVIAVGAGEPVGIQRLLAALPDLADAVPPGTGVQVVMTRVRESAVGRPAEDLVRGALDRYAGVRDAVLLPDERDVHDEAMLAGRSVAELAPQSRSATRLGELADRLVAETTGPRPGTAAAAGRRRRLFGRR